MHKWHEEDELTRRIINGNLRGFGQALGALVTFLDLSAVVIGGGVSGIGAPVIDPISEGISDTILKPNVGVRVLTTSLGSVSYTHLDVYKRQALTLRLNQLPLLAATSLSCSVDTAMSLEVAASISLKTLSTCLLYTSRCV